MDFSRRLKFGHRKAWGLGGAAVAPPKESIQIFQSPVGSGDTSRTVQGMDFSRRLNFGHRRARGIGGAAFAPPKICFKIPQSPVGPGDTSRTVPQNITIVGLFATSKARKNTKRRGVQRGVRPNAPWRRRQFFSLEFEIDKSRTSFCIRDFLTHKIP